MHVRLAIQAAALIEGVRLHIIVESFEEVVIFTVENVHDFVACRSNDCVILLIEVLHESASENHVGNCCLLLLLRVSVDELDSGVHYVEIYVL